MFLPAVNIIDSVRWSDLSKSKLFRFSVYFKNNCALRLEAVNNLDTAFCDM